MIKNKDEAIKKILNLIWENKNTYMDICSDNDKLENFIETIIKNEPLFKQYVPYCWVMVNCNMVCLKINLKLNTEFKDYLYDNFDNEITIPIPAENLRTELLQKIRTDKFEKILNSLN